MARSKKHLDPEYNPPSMPGHAPLALEEAVILATNVQRLRLDEGLNKSKFSLVAGITRPTLNKIESGFSDPSLSMVKKVADALGVSMIDLLTPPEKD